jgi:hypothetical protein
VNRGLDTAEHAKHGKAGYGQNQYGKSMRYQLNPQIRNRLLRNLDFHGLSSPCPTLFDVVEIAKTVIRPMELLFMPGP